MYSFIIYLFIVLTTERLITVHTHTTHTIHITHLTHTLSCFLLSCAYIDSDNNITSNIKNVYYKKCNRVCLITSITLSPMITLILHYVIFYYIIPLFSDVKYLKFQKCLT